MAFFVFAFLALAIATPNLFLAGAKPKKRAKTIDATAKPVNRLARADNDSLTRRNSMGATNGASRTRSARSLDNPEELFVDSKPTERRLVAAHQFNGDLRKLPFTKPRPTERPELEEPAPNPVPYQPTIEGEAPAKVSAAPSRQAIAPVPSAPAPGPITTFDGLDFATFGAGHPPDTNGDVGPTYYIQTVNTSIGIFNKSTGARVVGTTFNTFMSQGAFGNLCDTNNFGDPVVVYDTFEDRWVVTDFAFTVNGSNVVNSNVYQCFAVSKTGDPVSGGWNYYSIVTTDVFPDYPKFGVWPDGLYQSANCFGPGTGGSTFQFVRVWAINKAQMYAGSPTVQIVQFNAPSGEFTILPANARLQTGTPPSGSPNYFAVVWQFLNAMSVYKFHVDWDRISLSTFTGPSISTDTNWWEQLASANQTAPTPGNRNDELYPRLMMQNQYSNIGGVESLWASHTVGAGNPGASNVTATQSAVRFYQVKVTGGTVEAAPTQAWTYSPDASLWRYMPSIAVDRASNMAIGYTTSNATTNPALNYAAQTAGTLNNIDQTEQLLFQGTGAQTGNCGTSTCTRWGDYSTMSLDPDGCTFWYTGEYYAVNGLNDLTRIGSFKLTQCTTVGSGGTVSGTVTDAGNSNPISGATVALGSRTTTTNGAGLYTFSNIPAGTYPIIVASYAGYGSGSANSIVVNDSLPTLQNFALTAAPASACPTDTTQSDFQTGVASSTVDLTASPGDVTLSNAPAVDQSNSAGTTTGTGFGTPNWTGQTFIPAVTGSLVKADIQLFCSGCGGSPPNLTLSVRNTSAGLPTGADLASVTVPGSTFASGATTTYTATFSSPVNLTSGTQYALILRPVSAPAGSGYFWIRSSPSTYANGSRVLSADSGGTWSADTTRDYNFKTYMQTGYAASGDFTSGVRDANPAATGNTYPHWATLSWTSTVPANTTLKFQAAASNNANGPFLFVGPDGTAATFFTTSPANITQFNGFRYLKYKAYMTTTNSSATPTLSDVSVCFNNTAAPTAAPATISGRVTTSDGAPLAGVTMSLSGANSLRAITDSNGNYRFDGVPTDNFYTITPALLNFSFSPSNRSFSLLANKTDAAFMGTPDSVASANPLDADLYFVRQQYLDFLGREPDAGGLAYWAGQLAVCGGDAACLRQRRIDISAAYFMSDEFQQTGSFVYRLYRASYGAQPTYAQFMADRSKVIANGGDMRAMSSHLAEDWVSRPEFRQAYPDSMTASEFVNKLMNTAGISADDSNREQQITAMGAGKTRAQVLMDVLEIQSFKQREYNPSFVLMQYFGYLHRDPDSGGYQFWLDVLNNRVPGNYRAMVCAFITSSEYQRRFSSVVTHSNSECGQ